MKMEVREFVLYSAMVTSFSVGFSLIPGTVSGITEEQQNTKYQPRQLLKIISLSRRRNANNRNKAQPHSSMYKCVSEHAHTKPNVSSKIWAKVNTLVVPKQLQGMRTEEDIFMVKLH